MKNSLKTSLHKAILCVYFFKKTVFVFLCGKPRIKKKRKERNWMKELEQWKEREKNQINTEWDGKRRKKGGHDEIVVLKCMVHTFSSDFHKLLDHLLVFAEYF